MESFPLLAWQLPPCDLGYTQDSQTSLSLPLDVLKYRTASNSTIHLRAASRQKNQEGGQNILECKFIPNRKYLGLSLSCTIYLLWEAGNADVTVKVD